MSSTGSRRFRSGGTLHERRTVRDVRASVGARGAGAAAGVLWGEVLRSIAGALHARSVGGGESTAHRRPGGSVGIHGRLAPYVVGGRVTVCPHRLTGAQPGRSPFCDNLSGGGRPAPRGRGGRCAAVVGRAAAAVSAGGLAAAGSVAVRHETDRAGRSPPYSVTESKYLRGARSQVTECHTVLADTGGVEPPPG
jgi:hypothetical protein